MFLNRHDCANIAFSFSLIRCYCCCVRCRPSLQATACCCCVVVYSSYRVGVCLHVQSIPLSSGLVLICNVVSSWLPLPLFCFWDGDVPILLHGLSLILSSAPRPQEPSSLPMYKFQHINSKLQRTVKPKHKVTTLKCQQPTYKFTISTYSNKS